MICPHCATVVRFDWEIEGPILVEDTTTFILYDTCPSCDECVIHYADLDYDPKKVQVKLDQLENLGQDTLIYPKKNRVQNFDYIPEEYVEDYHEATKILAMSPKASAALSRRLLQHILRHEYKISKKNLSEEIHAFISLSGIPSHLTDAVDAIRHIGNLAAHPEKETETGRIVSVEPGEAEWLIEVIEALFDFTFIQPKKLEQRRNELNAKLEKLGKPQLKGRGTNVRI